MLYSVNSPYYRQFLSSSVNKYPSLKPGNTKRISRSRAVPPPQSSSEAMSTPAASAYDPSINLLSNHIA